VPLTDSDLILEDGTGKPNANAYIDRAHADSYHTLRDNTAWLGATTHTKIAAIIRATEYVDRRWIFVGELEVETQALAWPRTPAIDAEGRDVGGTVPDAIKRATAEYALRALDAATPLLPDPARDEFPIARKLESAGPVTEETEYATGGARRAVKSYPAADRLLRQSGLVLDLGDVAVRA
jgi:hypothetical protein